jgi:hypothetical protein
MIIRARVVGATLLFTGLLLDAACSSSSSSGGQAGNGAGGDSETGGRSQAGASARGGSAGAAKGGAPNKAGAGPSDAGSAGASGEGGTSGAGGAGGEAGGDPCAACPSGVCLPTGECVACLPSNDNCPDGQYCSAANTCVSGCKNASSCASGVCGADHDCQSCISDLECSAPEVCGATQCAAACTADQEGTSMGCAANLTCCGAHCVDAKTDSQHCGACGTACAAGQLCGVTGCLDSTIAAACSVAKVTVVLDGQDGNAVPARAIAAALLASCAPAPTVREVSQDVADAVNATSGRPVAGGDELLVSTGGGSFAHLTAYLNGALVAPIAAVLDGDNYDLRKTATGEVVAHTLFDAPHDSSDAFVIQFIRDPSSGSLILNAQGLWQGGTSAAAYYFVNVMLPTLATETKSWYVLQWTDMNANLTPDAGDTYELTASGP